MSKCRRRTVRGGALVLKKPDEALRQRVREVGGEKVGVVPVDVAKKRVCAMVTDFYGGVLSPPKAFPVTASGLDLLHRTISEVQQEHGLQLVVIGVEQTGRLHEPVRRMLASHYDVKLIHPLVTKSFRQGISRDIKTDGMDLDAQARAVIGCYGSTVRPLPLAYERWRVVHRAREQLVDDRAALKVRMHERIQAVLPGFAAQFENLWASPAALTLLGHFECPAGIRQFTEDGLRQWLRDHGASCTRPKAEQLLAWAADAVPPAAAAATEASVIRADLEHLAMLSRQIEGYDRKALEMLVQSPFVLLLSVPGISHVLAAGLGAEAGPMSHYLTARMLSGRAGLYERRYQSDETDRKGRRMAHGNPFLRDVLMKSGRCLVMRGGAFFAWGESRRRLGWCEKEIVAAMANRFCRLAHPMILSGHTFTHPSAKPGVSVLGKLLNVSSDLGLDADQVTGLALDAMAQVPRQSFPVELKEIRTGAWKHDNRPREHGASPATTRQITQQTVPTLLGWLQNPEGNHDITASADLRSP